jgi:ABC-type xylose transport system substrate-binding protein
MNRNKLFQKASLQKQRNLSAASSRQDVAAQIALFNQMMLSGVDAIILDAASDTILNQVVERAAHRGIWLIVETLYGLPLKSQWWTVPANRSCATFPKLVG